MNLLPTIRRKPKPWTRRVFGLFVVVWLNLALQPCVMAFGDADDHGCPGCPPTSTEEISLRSAHEAANSKIDSSMCVTSTAECLMVDDVSVDGRKSSVGVKDAPSDVPVGIAPSLDVITPTKDLSAHADDCDTLYLPGGSPPLNILFCVYLI